MEYGLIFEGTSQRILRSNFLGFTKFKTELSSLFYETLASSNCVYFCQSIISFPLLHFVSSMSQSPSLMSNSFSSGPRHTRHYCTQYCNKKILQLKYIFGPWMFIGQGKLLSKHNTRYTRFFRSLPWLFNRNLLLKIVKCCNIFLLQYCVKKCLV